MSDVTLSLVSHTNVGKTTLARTLLRRDVGEVRDQAHVTEVSEAHPLIEAGEDRLMLWDTPGLGDTMRLVRRLRKEGNPVGWFLHQVWDRSMDRPLWCSQEALRNVREDADVVLYLVNAAESPEDAGYVVPELEILSWLGRPTLVVLNQVGAAGDVADRLEAEWRDFLGNQEVVRDVLSLDAFARSWVQENVLFDRVRDLLEGEPKRTMTKLAEAWRARNQGIFDRSIDLMARDLARTATDREPLTSAFAGADKKRAAMEALGERLQAVEDELWEQVIAAHGLEGEYASAVRGQLDSFRFRGQENLTPKKGAMLGSVISGAVGGLTADILAGGLSFGGGLLAGTLLGALGGAGLSHAARLLKTGEKPAVSWSPAFLDGMVVQHVLRYLSVANFGRGRGRFEETEELATWDAKARAAHAARQEDFGALWRAAETQGPDEVRAELDPLLRSLVESLLSSVYGRGGGPSD